MAISILKLKSLSSNGYLLGLLSHPPFHHSQAWEEMLTKLFRFEAMWTDNSECKHIISRSWNAGVGRIGLPSIMDKISQCSVQLHVWNRDFFGSIRKRLQEAKN